MIATAVTLFQRQGYRATTWRGLVREADAPWGSVQHHFPGGKQQLAVAAVELGGTVVREAIVACQQDGAPPDAIRAWFELSAALLEASSYEGGCPIAAVALETASDAPAIAAACEAAVASWVEAIADNLRGARLDEARAGDLAVLAVAAFEGAVMIARLQRSTTPLLRTADLIADEVERAIGS